MTILITENIRSITELKRKTNSQNKTSNCTYDKWEGGGCSS